MTNGFARRCRSEITENEHGRYQHPRSRDCATGCRWRSRSSRWRQKIAWIEGLLAAGVDIIQLGSFVQPEQGAADGGHRRAVRPFSAPKDRKPAGAVLSGLVLNEKGLERGMACGVEMFCMGVSASETHSQKNTGMATAEATRRIIAMAQAAMSAEKRVQVSVQSAFGCGFEGAVPAERVLEIVDRFLDAGLPQHQPGRHGGPRPPAAGRSTCSARSSSATARSSAPAISTTPTAWAWPTAAPPWTWA